MFISISGNVDGVVWPVHYSDIALKHPEKKFKVGANIKARVSASLVLLTVSFDSSLTLQDLFTDSLR